MRIRIKSKFETVNYSYFIQNKRYKVELWQKLNLTMILIVIVLFYALCEVFIYKNYINLFIEGTLFITIMFLCLIGFIAIHFFNQIKFKILGRFENKEESIRRLCEFLKEFNLDAYVDNDRNSVYTNWIEPFPLNYGIQLFFIFSEGYIYFNARRADKKIVFRESKKLESILICLKSKISENSL